MSAKRSQDWWEAHELPNTGLTITATPSPMHEFVHPGLGNGVKRGGAAGAPAVCLLSPRTLYYASSPTLSKR